MPPKSLVLKKQMMSSTGVSPTMRSVELTANAVPPSTKKGSGSWDMVQEAVTGPPERLQSKVAPESAFAGRAANMVTMASRAPSFRVRFISLFSRASWIARGDRYSLTYVVSMARGGPKCCISKTLILCALLVLAEWEISCIGYGLVTVGLDSSLPAAAGFWRFFG